MPISRRYIDIAVNLTDGMFKGVYHGGSQKHKPDYAAVVSRAFQGGCKKLLLCGGSLNDSIQAVELCKELDPDGGKLFCTVGVHPTRVGEFENEDTSAEAHFGALRKLIAANLDRVAAIGEMGLDKERTEFCDYGTQLKYFELQLRLVEEFQLPMFLHMRAAGEDFYRILNENKSKWCCSGGVAHSFTGTREEMELITSLGLGIGLNGCSLRAAESLQAVVPFIPVDKLMFETDAPYCDIRQSHAGYKYLNSKGDWWCHGDTVKKPEKWEDGKMVKSRNEPCLVGQVAAIVASVHPAGDGVVEAAYNNTLRVFTKMQN
ncbi:Deoxyribonuclease tatD, putative [Perkinsus marinus ATCC 50983]|uniref:Deoxyribonuclease tatD, putative n=1 Tax=Perkinsus marinus (strain ATCC 50983 / TXsc) TaxID=423536 RepID=C5L7P0_PERM5|nr:Deoxyribonuclease tatD, putative [Perkinsus marinus ATCC 50983]EER07502.1 Deoxyribonuclease tatD, putative [Perkinsus marinus ATCC 50983]|eukprot:XP_002775686.1 Deoxyribonuclease tatD, putative [Perkinsus marinus ATCC 50983]